ncbi:MAG: hypothetical protein ACREUI_01670 [Burkholderiales bacterium]
MSIINYPMGFIYWLVICFSKRLLIDRSLVVTIIDRMANTKKNEKQRKNKSVQTKIIHVLPDDILSNDGEHDYEEGSGVFVEKEDIHIIYNALRGYKPTDKEEQRYELLLEEVEEILVCYYGDAIP